MNLPKNTLEKRDFFTFQPLCNVYHFPLLLHSICFTQKRVIMLKTRWSLADSFLSQTIRGLLSSMQTHCLTETNTCTYTHTHTVKSRNVDAHHPVLSRRIVGDFSPASEKKCLSCLDFFISQWFVILLSLSNSQSSTNDRHSQLGWGLACSVGDWRELWQPYSHFQSRSSQRRCILSLSLRDIMSGWFGGSTLSVENGCQFLLINT